jgi:hypothetical protein
MSNHQPPKLSMVAGPDPEVKHLASVELDFCFVMGPNRLRGIDLFNLARQNGRWVIIHKSYWL